jgi:hypothetical protein
MEEQSSILVIVQLPKISLAVSQTLIDLADFGDPFVSLGVFQV